MARVIVNGGAVLSRSLLPPGDLLPAGCGAEVDRLCEFSDNRRNSISQDCQKIYIILSHLQEKFLEEGRARRRGEKGSGCAGAGRRTGRQRRRPGERGGAGWAAEGEKGAHFLENGPGMRRGTCKTAGNVL